MKTCRERRTAELFRTLQLWPWTSPVPTAQMVVDETNRRVSAERKDIKRQGMWSTVEDFEALVAAV